MCLTPKNLKALLQTFRNHFRQPEMQRTGDQSRSIGGLGQIIAKFTTHEIRHPLGRSRLLHISLLPTKSLQILLKRHNLKFWAYIITIFIFHIVQVLWSYFNHHTRITPGSSPTGRTHAVHHNLFLIGCRRNHKTSRAHTEGIHTSSVNLSHHRILCSRQIFAPTLFRVILNLINQMRGMFQSHTNSNSLGLDLNLCLSQIAIDITCRMTCSQNHRTTILLISHAAHHLVAIKNQLRHLGLEMYFATTINNSISHRLNHLRQAICADMWVGISQNSR